MNIPNIRSNTIPTNTIPFNNINTIPVKSVFTGIAPVQTLDPPVTVQIGSPIVDMPGCVDAHETNNPLNENLSDTRGIVTYCDGQYPSFNIPTYTPNETLPTRPAQVDTRFEQPDVKTDIPERNEGVPPPIECPTKIQRTQQPIGTYINGFRDKVIAYELIDDVCVQITESVPVTEQVISGLPSGGQVMQVGGIAVIATTSALLAKPLADLLLKVVKPTVKKVMKKIAKIRGKQLKSLSVKERQAEQRDRNQAIAKLKSVKVKVKK